VIRASGSALPTPIIVKARYVGESFVITPINVSKSINNPET